MKPANLFGRSRLDYIFHPAGQGVLRESWKKPELTLSLNVVSSVHLLEGVLQEAPRARVVLVSSGQVYGTSFLSRKRLSERKIASPVNPYAGSKLLMEMSALNFVKQYGLHVVIARAFNQVGPGQKISGVFIARMEKGK